MRGRGRRSARHAHRGAPPRLADRAPAGRGSAGRASADDANGAAARLALVGALRVGDAKDLLAGLAAGLDVVGAVAALDSREHGELRVRVGIATGVVVAGDIVGEGASEERAVLGETPNLAARLQALAGPGQVVIAEATRTLTAGRFDLEPLGPQKVKGLREPVHAFRVKATRATIVGKNFKPAA